MIELMFWKELVLIKQVHQKTMMFVTIGIFLNYNFKVQPNVCNSYHDLLMILILILLSDIAILNIKSSDYYSIVSLAKIKL